MKWNLTSEDLLKIIDGFLENKQAGFHFSNVDQFGNNRILKTSWRTSSDDDHFHFKIIDIEVKYLENMIFSISIGSGAGWIPNDHDRVYVLEYLKPLMNELEKIIGKPERELTTFVPMRESQVNYLEFEWYADKKTSDIVNALSKMRSSKSIYTTRKFTE